MNKKVITYARWNSETGELLEERSYQYDGARATVTAHASAVDEDDWWGAIGLQNAPPPVAWTAMGPGWFGADEQFAASAAPGVSVVDEDFQLISPPAPPSAYQSLLPVLGELPAGVLFGLPDEDFWVNPVSLVPAALLYPQPWIFDAQEPAGALRGQPDEDFWMNPVAPVPATLIYPQPWTFDMQEPAGVLYGQPDEDFWVNSIAPIPATLSYPQPWSFDIQESAGALFGQPDEDFWQNPVPPLGPTLYQPLPYWFYQGDIAIAVVVFQSEEDFCNIGVAPAATTFSLTPQWMFDTAEVSVSRVVQEEDAPPPAPGYTASTAYTPLLLPQDTSDLLVLTLDEDYLPPAAASPPPARIAMPVQDQAESPSSAPGVADEDYWLGGYPPAAPATLYVTVQIPFGYDVVRDPQYALAARSVVVLPWLVARIAASNVLGATVSATRVLGLFSVAVID